MRKDAFLVGHQHVTRSHLKSYIRAYSYSGNNTCLGKALYVCSNSHLRGINKKYKLMLKSENKKPASMMHVTSAVSLVWKREWSKSSRKGHMSQHSPWDKPTMHQPTPITVTNTCGLATTILNHAHQMGYKKQKKVLACANWSMHWWHTWGKGEGHSAT